MRSKWLLVLLVVALAGVLAACGGGDKATETTTEAIKVGAIFDLTGPTSDVGKPYAEGIKGYVKWLNDNGGINGRPIDLRHADYAYKVDQAEQLYSQFVQEGVVAFQGWGTGDTEALRSRIAADQIPFMSASYSANLVDPKVAPYNFVIGTTYSDQAIIAIKWAMQDWAEQGNTGKPKVALVHHDSPFGKSPVEDAKAFAEANGVAFMSLPMPKGATDYVAELTKIKDFGANYIIIHTVSSPAATFVKDARAQGMDAKIINLNWCADEFFIELAGDAAEGVYGVQPFTPPSVPVEGHKIPTEWAKANGKDVDVHFIQGWYTMDVMTAGIRKVVEQGKEVTGPNIKAALETLTNYETGGVTYPITFTPESHRGNLGSRVYQVVDKQWTQVTDYITVEP
ncbi:MAG: ABC transporter substrate-binding protein [Chloroflexi bacterium]|nr:ABC transporter substrate-binding protein [Chloroflexota bacterium]